MKNVMKLVYAWVVLFGLGSCMPLPESESTNIPTGVTFHKETLSRADGHGDNWCMSWGADDSIVTSMCDGNWLGSEHGYHNHS